jgi:hypothetical protein
MKNLTLTDFTDIAEKDGQQKVTQINKVRKRRRAGYQVQCDFYKKFRQEIVKVHRENQPLSNLNFLVNGIKDRRKVGNYSSAISAYQSWCKARFGNKKLTWVRPPRAEYTHNGLGVTVNPELGLECEGECYVVKLYINKTPISALKKNFISELIGTTLKPELRKEKFGILDVKHAKFYAVDHCDSKIHEKIDAELDYLAPIFATE